MTGATIVAVRESPAGGPACLLPAGATTLLDRLLTQLDRIGAAPVRVVTRPEWRELVGARCADHEVVLADHTSSLGRASAGPAPFGGLLLDAEVVVNDTPLRAVVGAAGGAALVGPLQAGRLVAAPPCEVARDRLLTVGGAHPAHRFLRVMRLPDDLPVSTSTPLAPTPPASPDVPAGVWTDDPLLDALDGALRGGVSFRAVHLREAEWHLPDDQTASARAVEAVEAVDEEALRLAAAVKAEDGWFTTHLVSPYSRYLARWAARRGLTPDQVTIASLVVGVAAAAGFATGVRAGMVAGAILLQLAFTLDCVDGQLARYAGTGTARGGWLDAMFDRLKEYVVYAGLAAGAVRVEGDLGVWHLAVAALVLQTLRHHVDLAYEADELDRWDLAPPAQAAVPRQRPVQTGSPGSSAFASGPGVETATAPSPPRSGGSGAAQRLVEAARRVERSGPLRWLKRIVVLPIGERFALISLVAAVANARQVFLALLVWGGLALAYTATGRLARTSG